MIVTFVGHSHIEGGEILLENIKETIKASVCGRDSVTFYCGGYGDFDELCARACRELKGEIPHGEVVFVTPYITAAQQKQLSYFLQSGLYDAVIYPPLETVPPRFAISKRNEWMIHEADLVIAYVSYTYGGAYKTLQHAKRQKKNIINLSM